MPRSSALSFSIGSLLFLLGGTGRAQVGGPCNLTPPVQSYILRTLPPGFVSIAGQPGTMQAFPSCSTATNATVPLPFPITFFGQAKTTLKVHRNGFLHFEAGNPTAGANAGIPNPNSPNDYAAPFWENLQPAPGTGEVLVQVAGPVGFRVFTAEWKDLMTYGAAPCIDNGSRLNFQAKIYEADGSIEFHYGSFTPPGTGAFTATIGLEDSTGSFGLEPAALNGTNATFPPTNLRFYPGFVSEVLPTYTLLPLTPAFSSIAGVPGATQVFFPPAPPVCFDDEGATINLPFPFEFWTQPKTSVQMSMNGIATFDFSLGTGGAGNPNAAPASPGSPAVAIPNDYAAAFWDDLTCDGGTPPNAGGWWMVTGPPGSQSLVMEWVEVDKFQTATCTDTGDRLTFQIHFFESGSNVVFVYGPTVPGTAMFNSTIGLENSNGTDGFDATGLAAANTAFPANDLLLTPCQAKGIVIPLGNGCPGTLATPPTLGTTGGNPVIGNAAFAVTLSGGPANSPANVLVMGGSGTQWLGFNLPLGLAVFGFPACSLFPSLDILVSGIVSGPTGSATLAAPIPNVASLVGGSVWIQWFSITSPPGLASTGGARVIIG